jgi:hypothetical protein
MSDEQKDTQVDLTDRINKAIIDAILQSPLNVDFIPDDIERQMYERIFEVVEEFVLPRRTMSVLECIWNQLCSCFRSRP